MAKSFKDLERIFKDPWLDSLEPESRTILLRESGKISVSAPTLLSNAVIAEHAAYATRTGPIEAIGGEAMRTEDLRQIAPTRLDGINLRGTFDFPIARYAHRLLPSAATPDPLSQQRTA